MFERFTAGARQAVVDAQEEARRLGHQHTGSEHLLLALTRGEDSDAARATLEEFGLTHQAIDAQLQRIAGVRLDAAALDSIGIDLEAVRRRVEAEFGPGALDETAPTTRTRGLFRRGGGGGSIPFTDDAKVALELALREAISLKSREIISGHLLLGLIRGRCGLGFRLIEAHGADPGLLRTRLAQRMRVSA